MEGWSLLERRARPAVVSQYGRERYSIRTADWKLIRSAAGAAELYDLDADPGERANVAERRPEVSATLIAALDRWRERHRDGVAPGSPVTLSPEDVRELESLGYLR
jgi:arylsulfatase A-like enzyme